MAWAPCFSTDPSPVFLLLPCASWQNLLTPQHGHSGGFRVLSALPLQIPSLGGPQSHRLYQEIGQVPAVRLHGGREVAPPNLVSAWTQGGHNDEVPVQTHFLPDSWPVAWARSGCAAPIFVTLDWSSTSQNFVPQLLLGIRCPLGGWGVRGACWPPVEAHNPT